jgi:hypothetical protein
MPSQMHTEIVRVVADWMAEAYDFDDLRAFALTCRTAQQTLQEELEWMAECDREDRETDAMEREDFDVGRKPWRGRVNSDGLVETDYSDSSSEESSRFYTREEIGDWAPQSDSEL